MSEHTYQKRWIQLVTSEAMKIQMRRSVQQSNTMGFISTSTYAAMFAI